MTDTGAPEAGVAGRLLSLDLFRGATFAAMILVNNPGDWRTLYWPLLHAPWHGWALSMVVLLYLVALWMQRREIYLKV